MSESRPRQTVIILNPNSGGGNHSQAVRNRAELRGYSVEETGEAGDAIVERLLDRDAAHLVRTQTSAMTITIQNPESIRFSFDGEIVQQQKLSISVRPRTLTLAVGDTYTSNPGRE